MIGRRMKGVVPEEGLYYCPLLQQQPRLKM